MHEILPFSDETRATSPETVTVRPGTDEDAAQLERLGALEGRDPGSAPHLVAAEDGEVVAALSLRDGTVVCDPFRLTRHSVDQLRARAAELSGRPPARPGIRRRALTALASAGAALALAATALAVTPTALVSGTPVKINPSTKSISITVRCAAVDVDCEGVLDVRTAGKIKPYSSSPAAVAKVGTFPFRIAAGTSGAVKGRVYGPALAQAMLRGRVALAVTPRAIGGDLGPTRTVLFTYRVAR